MTKSEVRVLQVRSFSRVHLRNKVQNSELQYFFQNKPLGSISGNAVP